MGERGIAAGVPLDRLDAGSAWDGYHLYERGLEERIRSRTPKGGPWWVYFYAPATDSAYVVSSKPLKNHVVVSPPPLLLLAATTNRRTSTCCAAWARPGRRPIAPEPIVTRPAPGGPGDRRPAVDEPWRRDTDQTADGDG